VVISKLNLQLSQKKSSEYHHYLCSRTKNPKMLLETQKTLTVHNNNNIFLPSIDRIEKISNKKGTGGANI